MENEKILAMVLAGGEGTRLAPLTTERSKPAVPFVRVIDRKCTLAIELALRAVGLGQLVALHLAGDVIHAQRCLLVAFAQFLDAVAADPRVVVGHIAWRTVVILEHIERVFRCIDDEGVFLLGVQFKQVARHACALALLFVAHEPRARFIL